MAAIIGTESNDVLFGTGEDDYFDGKAGEDAFNGSFGNDTYLVQNPGTEIIEYFREGWDKAIVFFDYSLPANVENLDLEAGTIARGNGLSNLIEGNRENNRIKGFSGSDTLYGFDGADALDGGGGNDRLYGGGGNDILIAGTGYDELYGGAGDDTYIVSSYAFKIEEQRARSRDTLQISLSYQLDKTGIENLVLLGKARFGTGSAGDNLISGNRVGNVLSGLEGNDRLLGHQGRDTLYGNEGSDILRGGAGADALYGQAGNDRLFGDANNDLLIGENGSDILTGWGGGKRERDRLSGGAGADRFVLSRDSEIYYVGSGYATILDFDRAEQDKLQLHGSLRDYRLVTRPLLGKATADTAIYRGNDLIAIVQDARIAARDLFAG